MDKLISNFNLQKKLNISFKNEEVLVFVFIGLYLIFSWAYGFATNGTWDDDCPTRYFNTLNAFNDPKNFISVWNRPLFVIIFAPLVPLGKWVITFFMPLICAFGAFYLYKGIKHLKVNHAFLIVPLLLFQTYFFSISRNAETEPLSVTIIALGFYFLVKRKWFWFALIGGLIPLARLELSVLLVFWAWYLIKEKQFKYILYLGIPTVLWNVAGWIIEGDFLYVFNSTIGKDNSSNRYGHTTFGHYFQRYIYVIGPVIYLFFITGIAHKIKAKKWDAFVLLQFIAGFMMYVIFSWKLNIGNAAGFLRNLTPLSPFIAILGLEGYNYFWKVLAPITENKNQSEIELPPKMFKTYTEEEVQALPSKKRNQYFSKLDKWEAKVEELKLKESKKIRQQNIKTQKERWYLVGFLLLVVASVFYFHSYEIKIHHALKEEKDYTNLFVISGTVVLSFLSVVLYHKNIIKTKITYLLGIGIGLASMGFTLITEPPSESMSPERTTVEEIANVYSSTYLNEKSAHVNHPWFYWSNDFDRWDSIRFRDVTLEELSKTGIGNICIYENHYSHRLKGDVPKNHLNNRLDWIELTRKISTDRTFQVSIFEKTDSTISSGIEKISKYISVQPEDASSYLIRSEWHQKNKDTEKALADLKHSTQLDSSFVTGIAHFKIGLIYFNQKKYNEAINHFLQNTKLSNDPKNAYYNIGVSFYRLNKNDSALSYFDKTIAEDEKYENAYNLKSVIYKKQKKYDQAIKVLEQFKRVSPKNEQNILKIAQVYFDTKNWEGCVKELSDAIAVNPNNGNSYFIRGICQQNLNKNSLACEDWKKAIELRKPQAINYINLYCK